MDVGSMLYEIDEIDKELVRLRKVMRELGDRKKQLTTKTIDTLKEKGETEYTHNGKKYMLEERVTHVRKTDKKKRQDAISILQEEGYETHEAEEMYEKITGALKGPETNIVTLKK